MKPDENPKSPHILQKVCKNRTACIV